MGYRRPQGGGGRAARVQEMAYPGRAEHWSGESRGGCCRPWKADSETGGVAVLAPYKRGRGVWAGVGSALRGAPCDRRKAKKMHRKQTGNYTAWLTTDAKVGNKAGRALSAGPALTPFCMSSLCLNELSL